MAARALAALALASSLAAGACSAAPERASEPASEPGRLAEKPAVGVMTTLPLLWAEADSVGELLAANGAGGWVRAELDRHYAIEPLDTLDAAALAKLDRLVLAQPRPLTPAENVALDAWVRRGGKLLLFADPMLTRPSRYPVGDPRRPQDVALLSPILAHWRLELRFDDAQAEGEQLRVIDGVGVPVNLAGSLALAAGARCTLAAQGLLARCRLGQGSAAIVADAALLDDPESGTVEQHRRALSHLLGLAFA